MYTIFLSGDLLTGETFQKIPVLYCQFYIAPSGQQLTSHADMVKWLSTTEQNHDDIKKYLPLVFKVPDTSFHPVILTLRNMTISSYKRQKNKMYKL